MASMTFSDLTNLLYENYGGLVVDNVVRQGPGNWLIPDESILGRLRSAGKVFVGGADGNDRYPREWGVKTAGKTAASYGEGDAYPAATQPTWIDASLAWKRNGELLDIDNLVRLATRRGSMRGGLTGFGSQINDALKAVIAAIETQLATDGTGNGGKDITGFKAFLSIANTYATINQAGQPLWQANIVAGGGAALSNAMMRTMVRQAWTRNAVSETTEIWMHLLQFQKFKTLFDGYIRYAPGQATGSQVPYYDDGAKGIPIRVIRGVPTDEVWMVNLSDLEFRFLDHTPDDMLADVRDDEMMYEGVPIGFERVQTGKDSKSLFVKAYGQLVCTNPYRQSAITNLATTAP